MLRRVSRLRSVLRRRVWRRRDRWHTAYARADFEPLQATSPLRTHMWAGGFGWSGRRQVTQLSVMSRIDGVDVEVDTRIVPERAVPLHLRMMASRLVDAGLDGPESLELPLRVEIVAEDREVLVDGQHVTFEGVRRSGSDAWSGAAVLDGRWVQINVPDDVGEIELTSCREPDRLAEFPPPPAST